MSRSAFLVAVSVVLAMPALAHVGLEPAQAVASSTVTVAFRIGHGCEESPTTAVKIRIPAGVTAVQPQPKPGWTVAVQKGPLPGASEVGVTEVDFTGGTLPHDFFDTFVLRMKVPNAPNTTVYFPVVQECEVGVHRWIEPVVAGQPEPPEPMPGLRLVPAQ